MLDSAWFAMALRALRALLVIAVLTYALVRFSSAAEGRENVSAAPPAPYGEMFSHSVR